MKDDEVKPQLMKLLGISNDKIADKVLRYAELVNDGTTTSLVNTDNKQQAEQMLKALSANDFASAKVLNERVTSIMDMVARAYRYNAFEATSMDITSINKSYILLVNELQKVYARSQGLKNISISPLWEYFDVIEGAEWELEQAIYQDNSDAGKSHIAKINKLCIIAGIETPRLTAPVKAIVDEADKAISSYKTLLDEETRKNPPKKERKWFIPEYKVTYSLDGTIMINEVLKLKKVHAGSTSDKLIEQAIKNANTVFKPDVGQTTRNLSTILSSMGFSGTLRALFFPSVSKDKGILFRPSISHDTVKAERIDTTDLDTQLKKLGAETKVPEVSLDDIPF